MADKIEELTRTSELLPEADMQQIQEELKELKAKFEKMETKSQSSVKSLRVAADYLDKVWKDCKIARTTGISVSIVGGVLTIAGGIATILTAGAAFPLLVSGLAIGAAGGGVNVGASIADAAIKSKEIKKAQKDLDEATNAINEVQEKIDLWLGRKDKARLWYILLLSVETLGHAHPVLRLLRLASDSLGIPGKVLDTVGKVAADAGQAGAGAVTQAAKVGAQATGDVAEQGAKVGAKAAAKVAGGVIIGLSAAFLVVDLIDLGFNIRDLVENKGCDAARVLREKADALEEAITTKKDN